MSSGTDYGSAKTSGSVGESGGSGSGSGSEPEWELDDCGCLDNKVPKHLAVQLANVVAGIPPEVCFNSPCSSLNGVYVLDLNPIVPCCWTGVKTVECDFYCGYPSVANSFLNAGITVCVLLGAVKGDTEPHVFLAGSVLFQSTGGVFHGVACSGTHTQWAQGALVDLGRRPIDCLNIHAAIGTLVNDLAGAHCNLPTNPPTLTVLGAV
jgi:hypothetical protein